VGELDLSTLLCLRNYSFYVNDLDLGALLGAGCDTLSPPICGDESVAGFTSNPKQCNGLQTQFHHSSKLLSSLGDQICLFKVRMSRHSDTFFVWATVLLLMIGANAKYGTFILFPFHTSASADKKTTRKYLPHLGNAVTKLLFERDTTFLSS
jgi:hypothetical protein